MNLRRSQITQQEIKISDNGLFLTVKVKEGVQFIVSIDDKELVEKYNWSVSSKGYIRRHGLKTNGKWGKVYLHREIMGTPIDSQVDHINGDKLDNRRKNLRLCTNMQNHYNMPKRKDNTSGVTGVWFRKKTGNWVAEIKENKTKHYLGEYKALKDAVNVRIKAEKCILVILDIGTTKRRMLYDKRRISFRGC
jgi:hypothetical protein